MEKVGTKRHVRYTNRKHIPMKKTHEMKSGGYYMIESIATARSCYFESEEEIERFRKLFRRYLSAFVEIHKMYLSSEGYQILLRMRGADSLRKIYIKQCEKRGKAIKISFIDEPWRIVSEQMRIFHSVYAKWVNGVRRRSGGLVKERYSRYYFDSYDEYCEYKSLSDAGREIRGQKNGRYRVSNRWILLVRWGVIRSVGWVESLMNKAFQNYVVHNLVKSTFSIHKPPPK